MTYQPLTYRTSGGDELVFSTGAGLKIGGVDFLTTGGYIGDQRLFWEESTSTGAALTNYGVTIINSTISSTSRQYTIVPAAGRVKWVVCLTSTSPSPVTVVTTGTWDGTNKNILFSSGSAMPESFAAIGVSTSLWYLLHISTAATFSAT